MTGALISGMKNANDATSATATGQGSVSASRNSGSGAATIANPASRRRSTFCASFVTTTEPTTAPAPRPAKIQPRTCGLWSYRRTTSTCRQTVKPCAARLIPHAARSRGPSSLSRFAARQEDGVFRNDIDAIELARFVTMVLNGLALRVVTGDETSIEPLLRLLHDALAPRQ